MIELTYAGVKEKSSSDSSEKGIRIFEDLESLSMSKNWNEFRYRGISSPDYLL